MLSEDVRIADGDVVHRPDCKLTAGDHLLPAGSVLEHDRAPTPCDRCYPEYELLLGQEVVAPDGAIRHNPVAGVWISRPGVVEVDPAKQRRALEREVYGYRYRVTRTYLGARRAQGDCGTDCASTVVA